MYHLHCKTLCVALFTYMCILLTEHDLSKQDLFKSLQNALLRSKEVKKRIDDEKHIKKRNDNYHVTHPTRLSSNTSSFWIARDINYTP